MNQGAWGTAAAADKQVTKQACEHCGAQTPRFTLLFSDGRLICPNCAASERARAAEASRRRALMLAGGAALVIVAAIAVWAATTRPFAKAEIAKSIVRLHAAALAPADSEEHKKEQLKPYMDGDALYEDLHLAAEKANDPDPDHATGRIWSEVLTTAVQGGKVIKVDGDRAVLERKLNGYLRSGVATPFTFRFEMRKRGDEWCYTHVLNAEDVYATYRQGIVATP